MLLVSGYKLGSLDITGSLGGTADPGPKPAKGPKWDSTSGATLGVSAVVRTDPFSRRFDYGVSNDDVPNVVNFSGVWQIPNAPLHGLANKLVNGWELTSIANWRSGFPYAIFSNVDNSFSGVFSDRADFIGGTASLDQGRAHGQLVQQYFNVNAFVPNAIGAFGNSGKNILRGPRFFDTDLGLLKDFAIVERMKIQFRAEFFNAFNNVNFGQPQNYLGSSSTGQITSAGNPRVFRQKPDEIKSAV
jgi:hypothetical protein